jgi:hypothetical protein
MKPTAKYSLEDTTSRQINGRAASTKGRRGRDDEIVREASGAKTHAHKVGAAICREFAAIGDIDRIVCLDGETASSQISRLSYAVVELAPPARRSP